MTANKQGIFKSLSRNRAKSPSHSHPLEKINLFSKITATGIFITTMREENKQTEEQKTSDRAAYYLLKLLNSTRKILSNKNTIKIFTILICIGCFLAFVNKAAAAIDIDNMTPNEIINIKRNGLISALCFVQDLLTGNVARAVGALFILGSGWLFIIGYIKDWLPVLSFTIAITLIFGGAEFAKVISGNDITCKTLYGIKEVNEETIYNDGICKIVDINLYSRGQIWYLCNNNEGFDERTCSEVTGETIISTEDQSVFLVACQTGSSKENEKVLLQYRCNPEKGAFEIVNGDKIEEGKCKTSCTFDQLKNIVKFYHAKNTTGGESDNSKATSFKILDNSGELKLGKYFTVGTIIDLDCLSGYTEVEYNSEDEGNTQIEQNKPNNSALKATCTTTSSGAEFKVSGRCRTSCNLNNLSDNAREGFVKWEKYNEQTSLWEDTTAETFYFGDRVRIKTCNTDKGYSFDIGNDLTKQNPNDVKDSEKLIIKCGTNSANEETWISENGGKGCVKLCDITKNDFYNEHVWAKDCPTVEDCRVELQTGEKFFRPGEKVGIIECRDTDNYYLNREENPGVGPLKLTCNYGEWKTDSGIICQKKCKLNTIPFYEYAKTWNVCRNKINLDDENPPCYELALGEIENLVEGHTVQHAICEDEKGFKDTNADSLSNATDRKSIFTCNKEGEFIRDSEVTDDKVGVCSPQCFPKLLSKFDIDSVIWYESDENGNKINSGEKVVLETYNAEKISDPNKYFTLDKCNIGYELINENNGNSDKTIIKCNDERIFESHKIGPKCTIKKCIFNKETIKADLESEENSIGDYDNLGIEYSDSWTVVEPDDKKEIPIVGSTYSLNNSTSIFGYGTKLKVTSCGTGSSFFGNSDTVLKCNAWGKWELTIEANKAENLRCRFGVCKGISPNDLPEGNYYIHGLISYKEFYDKISGEKITPNQTNIADLYGINGSMIDLACTNSNNKNYIEVRFGGNYNRTNVEDQTKDYWDHYLYCLNGEWKEVGSCFHGCHSAINNSNNNDWIPGSASKEGIYYNDNGSKKNIQTESFNVKDTFATEGSVVDANCNAGFYKASTGGNTTTAHNWKHAYICQSNEWKSIGSCKKGCKVSDFVNTINNSSNGDRIFYGSNGAISNTTIGSTSGDTNGKFINSNGVSEDLTTSNTGNLYAEVGTVLDVNCSGNNEVGFGGNTTFGYLGRWTHYYVCEEGGVWKSRGSCFKGCTSVPTADASENISFADATLSGSVYNKTNGSLTTFDKNNMSSVYYGNNATITASCNTGYVATEGGIKYICNNGSWSKSGRCRVKSGSVTFGYTGNVQTFKSSDYYLEAGEKITLEVWGAQGGNEGGKGGYTKGTRIITNSNDTLYIYVGGKGDSGASNVGEKCNGGYNGGGYSYRVDKSNCGGGGGATDIRTSSSNNTRILVAGGGGGSGELQGGTGGGNNSSGGNGSENSSYCTGGNGGTISSGGSGGTVISSNKCADYTNGGSGSYYYGGSVNGNIGRSVTVKYISVGDSSRYRQLSFNNGTIISCNNATFGDPHNGTKKECYVGDDRVAYENENFTVEDTCYSPGGGGGGYYGGGAGANTYYGCGGGGGSGYCGISDCSGENGVNGSDTEIDGIGTNGNGYAKISW